MVVLQLLNVICFLVLGETNKEGFYFIRKDHRIEQKEAEVPQIKVKTVKHAPFF